MAVSAGARTTAAWLADAEQRDAWAEYLAATQGQPPARYREVEPWAWARLVRRLRTIGAR